MLQVFLEYCSTIIGEFKKEKGEKLQLKLAARKAWGSYPNQTPCENVLQNLLPDQHWW